MKAMILAAGRGKRMRHLTEHTPKPLLEVNGKPLIVYHLLQLARLGVRDVVINISYLAERLQTALGDGRRFGVNIIYSYEPAPLDTGGGVYQALPLLGTAPFLVISADIWTDYDFSQLAQKITRRAHLVLVPNPDYHPDGDFTCENGLLGLTGSPKFTFASFGIYHPALFKGCQPGAFPLAALYKSGIESGAITGEIYSGKWFNVGTPEDLRDLNLLFKRKGKI